METLEGEAPATEVVILVSSGLTRGQSNVVFQPDQEFWGHGWLMDPEKYTGEQYLFFGQPQVYLWQIKGSMYWPDQVIALKLLYQAPIARLTAFYYVVVFPFMDEFTIRNYVAFIAQTILIIATGILLIKKASRQRNHSNRFASLCFINNVHY